jgi:hypothetical protein
MKNSQSERNAAIVQQYRSGKPYRQIADDFKISPYRVRQIITTTERQEKRRAELENKYGRRPNIAALPDSTPIDVLLLCDAHIQGWAARLAYLQRSPYPSAPTVIKTLGDLRGTPDVELLREPNIGKKMLTELRRFCPPNTDEILERLFARIRALPPERKILAIDALTKICEGSFQT